MALRYHALMQLPGAALVHEQVGQAVMRAASPAVALQIRAQLGCAVALLAARTCRYYLQACSPQAALYRNAAANPAAACIFDPNIIPRHRQLSVAKWRAGRGGMQIDQFESEVEGLQTTGKRKSKPPPKLAHFEESLARHRQHVLRLEQMLRLLDNEGLSVEEVTETRDMVDDFMERNQVPRPATATLVSKNAPHPAARWSAACGRLWEDEIMKLSEIEKNEYKKSWPHGLRSGQQGALRKHSLAHPGWVHRLPWHWQRSLAASGACAPGLAGILLRHTRHMNRPARPSTGRCS